MISLLTCSVKCIAGVGEHLKEMKRLSLGIVRLHMVDWERVRPCSLESVRLPGVSVTCQSSHIPAGPLVPRLQLQQRHPILPLIVTRTVAHYYRSMYRRCVVIPHMTCTKTASSKPPKKPSEPRTQFECTRSRETGDALGIRHG
jgi:hypothetical protein